MIVINPRLVAADAMIEITRFDAYNNMALKKILKQNGAMDKKDKAFVTEIVNGTLRNLIFIDYILDALSSVKTTKMKPYILAVLRTGVYQLMFMDKVPPSAACNEAVAIVKEKGFGKLTGFVNGILRNVIRTGHEIQLPNEEITPAEYISVKYSHPLWLIKMWLSQYDYDFVKALCRKNNMAPSVTVAVNTLKITTADLRDMFEKEGVKVDDGMYSNTALHISRTSDMSVLESFTSGFFHVQDESSMLAVSVLDPKPNERILDVCAAPGGKSFLAAERMNNKGTVVSRDVFDHKLELMNETAARLGITIVKTENKDASVNHPEDNGTFDRVLVDAPCSGLGLIRKKPDIKLRKNGNDIDSLWQLQREILAASAPYVKPDGVLVYSTCTVCKKENYNNLKWFLETFDFELEDITPFLPNDFRFEPEEKGSIQLFPHIHDTDGFFIARMKRKGNKNVEN